MSFLKKYKPSDDTCGSLTRVPMYPPGLTPSQVKSLFTEREKDLIPEIADKLLVIRRRRVKRQIQERLAERENRFRNFWPVSALDQAYRDALMNVKMAPMTYCKECHHYDHERKRCNCPCHPTKPKKE